MPVGRTLLLLVTTLQVSCNCLHTEVGIYKEIYQEKKNILTIEKTTRSRARYQPRKKQVLRSYFFLL